MGTSTKANDYENFINKTEENFFKEKSNGETSDDESNSGSKIKIEFAFYLFTLVFFKNFI